MVHAALHELAPRELPPRDARCGPVRPRRQGGHELDLCVKGVMRVLPQLLAVQVQTSASELGEPKVVVRPVPLVELEELLGREGVHRDSLADLEQKVKPNETAARGVPALKGHGRVLVHRGILEG